MKTADVKRPLMMRQYSALLVDCPLLARQREAIAKQDSDCPYRWYLNGFVKQATLLTVKYLNSGDGKADVSI
jgi:hypothetical protein